MTFLDAHHGHKPLLCDVSQRPWLILNDSLLFSPPLASNWGRKRKDSFYIIKLDAALLGKHTRKY